MLSLSKLTPSVFAATQKNNAAVIAFNIDFAVFKQEASAEYRPLRKSLAPYRRKAAEDGELHFTARRLWALFQQVLPDTSNLYKAYGVRASDIASKIGREFKSRWWVGAFVDYQGVDGGSIWAAATSGERAVAVHLLACMLARMWSAPEATSIWEEIVMTRKEELKALALGPKDSQTIYAASLSKLSLTRQQLADWDASARAWLRAGDDANQFRRTQWMLNVRHLEKRVSVDSNVYTSVINSWCGAMIAVDKLTQGAPHSITDGSILLALSAWHLFPDMLESSNSRHPIPQNDPLFDSGGMLILGFEPAQIAPSPGTLPFNRDVEAFSGGVTWSLPLAYLRYYGNPVQRDSSLNNQESRISIDQLVQVATGCFFHGWQEDNFDIKQAAELLCFLWQHCSNTRTLSTPKEADIDLPSDRSWLGLLAGAAGKYLVSDNSSQETYRKLFYWGREQCPGFLGMTGHPESSIVALQHPQSLLKCDHRPGRTATSSL